MNGKEVRAAVINVLSTTGGNHIYDDTTNEQWAILPEGEVNTDNPLTPLFGKFFEYGRCMGYSYEASAAEVRQVAVLGIGTTETIAASTKYSLAIGNTEEKYEGGLRGIQKYSYTSPAVLSGTAGTDRANVYQSLVNKINARTNFVTASILYSVAYTGGTSAGDTATNFTIGETITQGTSAATAKVASCVIASGTMAGDDAAGTLYFYDVSGTLGATALGWTGATSAVVVTQAAAAAVATGIAVVDAADYFISHVNRGGASEVYVESGFANDTWTIARSAVYSRGIGSYLSRLAPVFSKGKEDIVNLFGDYMLSMNDEFDSALTYRTYVIRMKESVKDLNGVESSIPVTFVLFVSELNTATELTEFEAAMATITAK